MTIGRGQVQQGREQDGGIDIEHEIGGQGREGFFVDACIRGAPQERGGVRHRDGVDLTGAVISVRRHQIVNGGTGMRLLSCRLSLLYLVLLFTRGWFAEEWEAGRNRAK